MAKSDNDKDKSSTKKPAADASAPPWARKEPAAPRDDDDDDDDDDEVSGAGDGSVSTDINYSPCRRRPARVISPAPRRGGAPAPRAPALG